MLTKSLSRTGVGTKPGFRWRAKDVTRIESLSDAVFGFAVTLLIVSLEVPKTFDEVIISLRGVPAFAACFAQLMLVWYQHYLIYRRFNMQDYFSTVLTLVLLFVVLVFTYPLKYVFFTWLGPGFLSIEDSQAPELFTIYGVGVIIVFGIFMLFYIHAYRRRAELELSALELHDTKHSIREMLLYMSTGVISIVLARSLPPNLVGLAGASYGLTGPFIGFHAHWSGKRRDKFIAAERG